MIIGIALAILCLGIVLTGILISLNKRDDDSRTQKEMEQAQKDNAIDETTDTNGEKPADTKIPPVIAPEDTGGKTTKDDIILDVTDKDRDPNPGVRDVTIEYGTKEGAIDAE